MSSARRADIAFFTAIAFGLLFVILGGPLGRRLEMVHFNDFSGVWSGPSAFLLGVKAVIAESFERIHRSNLVGMGMLPLVFKKGQNRSSLGLTGTGTFEISIDDSLKPGQDVKVRVTNREGDPMEFVTTCRIDTPVEIEYYRNGGILPTVLRKMLHGGG